MHTVQTLGELAMVLCSLAGFLLMLLGWIRIKFSGIRSSRLPSLGFLLVGLGLFCGALSNSVAVHSSQILTAEGSISSLREVHSRGDAYYFSILTHPSTPELSAYYSDLHLNNGDLVRASSLSNTCEITAMTILSGTDALKTVHHSVRLSSALFFYGLSGVFFAIGFTLNRQRLPIC